ncbi:AAA family ATPase [Eubacteriaceae bacterium ES3]|nr:AAA family ATPase [Eubacteriaceae bacterium ES3]
MKATKSIAITGKGGTGKTVVATTLIRLLSERFPGRVLAIDADSAMSLPYTLDLEIKDTVSNIRKGILGTDQLRNELNESPTKEMMRRILTHADGYDLLVMGRPEEPGCFCAVNALLRYGIDSLAGDYDFVIIDGEAGPEQINRRVMESIDMLLVVADMSKRSLETAAGIIEVARDQEDGIKVAEAGLVLNRVKDDQAANAFIKKTGLEIFATLPEDQLVNSFDREGKSLLELPIDSPCPMAVAEIIKKLIPDESLSVAN